MSVGPLGNTFALSGTSQDVASQLRQVHNDQHAAQAASLSDPEADAEVNDRDADGRMPWTFGPAEVKEENAGQTAEESHDLQSKDPTGAKGGLIDMSG